MNNETPQSAQVDLTPLEPTTGWRTSQGQFTAIFTAVCLLLSIFGVTVAPEVLANWLDRIEVIVAAILPLIIALIQLVTYTNSRGKVASNTVNAKAAVLAASVAPPLPELATATALFSAEEDKWKDPELYEGLITLASEMGVPGASRIDKINQQVRPAELVTHILSIFKNKKKKQQDS